MIFHTSSTEFLRIVNAASKTVSKKNTLALLSYLRLSKEDGKFYITGGSVESTAKLRMKIIPDISDTDDGFTGVCLPTQTLKDALGTLAEQPLTVNIKDGKMTVKHSNGTFRMSVVSAEDYPQTTEMNETVVEFTINGGVFLHALKNAAVHTGNVMLRPQMSCVLIDLSAGQPITFAGTDGHTLYRRNSETQAAQIAQVLIPASNVGAIADAFREEDDITVKYDGKKVQLSTDGVTMTVIPPEGKFPNYNAVFPKESKYALTVSVTELTAAVKRASLMASTATELLRFEFFDNELHICTEDIDFSKGAEETVPLVLSTVPNDFPPVGIKSSNLLKTLTTIATDNVVIEFTQADRPIVAREDKENAQVDILIMPIILN